MSDAARKVAALVRKDAVDLVRNPSIAVCLVLPIAFAGMFRVVTNGLDDEAAALGATETGVAAVGGAVQAFLLSSALCMCIGMIVGMVIVYGIAEEKEKRTLRTLMLANVSAGEIAVARAAVTLAATAAVSAVCFCVVGAADLALLVPSVALCLVGAVPFVLIALVLGLAARDQMTAGMYSVPVVLLALAPMFGMYSEQAARVTALLPTGAMDTLVDLMLAGQLFTAEALVPLAILAAWTVAGAVAFKLLFARLARDN